MITPYRSKKKFPSNEVYVGLPDLANIVKIQNDQLNQNIAWDICIFILKSDLLLTYSKIQTSQHMYKWDKFRIKVS